MLLHGIHGIDVRSEHRSQYMRPPRSSVIHSYLVPSRFLRRSLVSKKTTLTRALSYT